MALPRAAAAGLEESSPLCSCTSAAALNFQHGKHGLGGNPSPPEGRGVHGLEAPASSPEVFPGNLPARQPIGSDEQPCSGARASALRLSKPPAPARNRGEVLRGHRGEVLRRRGFPPSSRRA